MKRKTYTLGKTVATLVPLPRTATPRWKMRMSRGQAYQVREGLAVIFAFAPDSPGAKRYGTGWCMTWFANPRQADAFALHTAKHSGLFLTAYTQKIVEVRVASKAPTQARWGERTAIVRNMNTGRYEKRAR